MLGWKTPWTVSAVVAVVALSACSQQAASPAASAASASDAVGADKKNIVIGTTAGDFGDMVKDSIKPILEQQGYTVKLTEFNDYVTPNKALAEGAVDVNVFQHQPYFDGFVAEHQLPLAVGFQVPTPPLGLYAGKLTSIEQAKDGMTIAAPNDPSNFARVLVMLDELGWIELKDDVNPLQASKNDIATNTKHIQFIEMEAANLPRARADADFAVINGNFVLTSGMKLTDALYQEPSYAYVNWGAFRSADMKSKWAQDVVAAYHSDAFKQYAFTTYPGYKYPAAWQVAGNGEASAPAASVAK